MKSKTVKLDVSEEVRKKLVLELETLSSASHPSIVTFHNAFYKSGNIHILMELMNCGTLADLLKEVKSIPEDILCKMSSQVCHSLPFFVQNFVNNPKLATKSYLMASYTFTNTYTLFTET